MKRLFLFGFVLTSLLTWTVAGAYTGTTSDIKTDPVASQVNNQDEVVNPAAAISIEDTYDFNKPKSSGPDNVPDENAILQGGDDCASATVISSLPFNDTGTTLGSADDYNEVCPYTNTGAPDVVYEFSPSANLTVDITLCNGSAYDTKLYVYENTCQAPGDGFDPYACNDDACPGFVSELIGVEMVAGNTYYIVIDGYSSADFGDYVIDMTGSSELSFCPQTPDPTIFSQSYLTGVNGVNSDVDGGIQAFEDYRTSGTINSVHWWGIKYFFTGTEWVECFEDPQSFEVAFWNDNGAGWPDISAPVYTETFVIGGDDTGDTFGSAGAPIYRYSATLTTPVTLDEGWVSIHGNPGGDANCWFLWHSSTDNNELSVGRDLDTDVLDQRGYDLSICLNGTYESLTGSCCDDLTGLCDDAVEVVDCPTGDRFTPGVLCADLDPPCGPQAGVGACCVGLDCTSPVEETDCDALGGFFYGGQDCGSFTCPADVLYHKDFDGNAGMGDWVDPGGYWGITSVESNSPPSSLADSPLGNYPDQLTRTVTLEDDIALTGYPSFSLEFMTKFEIEIGFDTCFVEISTNAGTTWIRLGHFNGESPSDYLWHLYDGDLGGYTDETIRIRFRFESDAGYNVDGIFIDDMFIIGDPTDNSPPLIVHTGPTDMEGIVFEHTAVATITDYSGVADASLTYSVEGGSPVTIAADQINGDEYTFIIPQQTPGDQVNYTISATDNNSNEFTTPNNHYISGTVVYYDDGDPEFVYQFAAGNKIATRFTPEAPATLIMGMFRCYTDQNRPIEFVDVEAWTDVLGRPGTSLAGPIETWPEATLGNPQAWTHVDFRGMGLDFAAGEDFQIGYTHRTTWPVILGESPMVADRSSQDVGAGWVAATTDFHIRAVLALNYGACCDEDNNECTMTYESQCQFTFSLGATCDEVGCGTSPYPCGHYVVGDFNGSDVFNLADVISAFSKLQTGSPDAANLCECPPGGGNTWAIAMDVNGNCAFNLADVISAFSKLQTGSPDLVGCPTCPPDPNPAPRGGNNPLVVPNLESKAKISNQSGME